VSDPFDIGRRGKVRSGEVFVELLPIDSNGPADSRNRAPAVRNVAQIQGEIA
jgi:hypothetical protein